jgi:SulP family sulfate permease
VGCRDRSRRRRRLPAPRALPPQGARRARGAETFEDAETTPGLVIYRFDAPLFFANADVFRDQVLRLVADGAGREPVHEVLVNGEAIYDIDTTGIAMLERLHGELKDRGVRLTFARIKSATRNTMRRSGFEELVGADAFTLQVEDEVKAFADAATPSGQPTTWVRPPSRPQR